MNSTERFAAKLTNVIYCIFAAATILAMVSIDRMSVREQYLFGSYLLLSIVISQVITRKKSISHLTQGRVEIILFLFLCILFVHNTGWGRMGTVFFLTCLFSVYQLPQLNAELLGLTVLIYGLLILFYEKSMLVHYYESRTEIAAELFILLFAQVIMLCLQKQNAFERRKVYENEQSLDDLLKVVELKCDEAQEAVRVKSSFLANMSHEIRTPINAILGMNEMILRETNQDDVAEYAENVQSAGKSLTAIINSILDFSKIESGKMELVPAVYSFSSLLNDLTNLLQGKAEQKGLQLILEIDGSIPDLLIGDEMRVKQILVNLLDNAVKYTKSGTVRFIAQFESQEGSSAMLCIKVVDTGIGIKEEEIDKLFDSFARLDLNHNRDIEGTGLGLAITKQLITMCEGTLEVESTYGRGSCFTLHLPQQIKNPTPIGNYQKRLAGNRRGRKAYREMFTAKQAHILVVDDNIINLKVAAALLKDTRLQIELAASGMECLEKCEQMHFDVILMDHMMPQMDGVETLQRFRAQEKKAPGQHRTVVIVLTANAVSGAREMYLKQGFDDYLAKPIDSEKLESMLKFYLPKELLDTERTQEERAAETPQGSMRAAQMIEGRKEIEETEETEVSRQTEAAQLLWSYFDLAGEEMAARLGSSIAQGEWRACALQLHEIYSIARGLEQEELAAICRQEEALLREEREAYAFGRLQEILDRIKEKINGYRSDLQTARPNV